jgi:hypothetical protein
MPSNALDQLTSLFQVHQPSGICKSSTTLSLFLLALWIPPAATSLTLGSSVFRARLSRIKKQPFSSNDPDDRQLINRFYLFVSVSGSFFLQAVLWNIAHGQLLADGNSENSVSDLYWVWLIRPLPGTFVLFVAYACPTLYLENALEMQFVEGATGLLSVRIYDEIRSAVRRVGHVATQDVRGGAVGDGLKLVSHGANLGLAFWVLSLLVAVWAAFLLVRRLLCEKPFTRTQLRLWTAWSIVFNLMRMVAGFMIWAGIATVDDRAFCPNLAATGAIAATVAVATLVDHVWRAFFHVEGTGRFKSIGPIAKYVDLIRVEVGC